MATFKTKTDPRFPDAEFFGKANFRGETWVVKNKRDDSYLGRTGWISAKGIQPEFSSFEHAVSVLKKVQG